MSLDLGLSVTAGRPEGVEADLLLVACFEGERPLRGAAGRVDWRECGLIGEEILAGFPAGASGRELLVPSSGRFASGRAMLFGLGPRPGFAEPELATALRAVARRAIALRAGRVALALPGEAHAGLDAPTAALVALASVAEAVAAEPFPLHLILVVEPGAGAAVRAALADRGAAAVPPGIALRPSPEAGEEAFAPGAGAVPEPGLPGRPAGPRGPWPGPSSLP